MVMGLYGMECVVNTVNHKSVGSLGDKPTKHHQNIFLSATDNYEGIFPSVIFIQLISAFPAECIL